MLSHNDISDEDLRQKIRLNLIQFGGNKRLKIYGTLQCQSGKRMKRENRVFFAAAAEAIQHNYRACGHCLPEEYKKWISLKE